MIILKNKAFLLVEVLITVVVIAVSIIFINHAFTSSVKAVSLSNSYRKAVLFLKNRTFDLELSIDSERDGLSFPEEEESTSAGFLLKSQRLPLSKDDMVDEYDKADLEIERFTVSIEWQARGAQREIDILTYVPVVIEGEEE